MLSFLSPLSAPNGATKVIIFASTVNKDPTFASIIKKLKKRGVPVLTSTSFYDQNGHDQLEELVTTLMGEDRVGGDLESANSSDDEPEVETPLVYAPVSVPEGDPGGDEEPFPYKAPEYIIVADDLGEELKNKRFHALLKKNRHARSKVIVSSQYYKDLVGTGPRTQLDNLILFGGIPEEMLEQMHKEQNLTVPIEHFKKMYHHATRTKYNFLTTDVRNDVFRHNFDQKFV